MPSIESTEENKTLGATVIDACISQLPPLDELAACSCEVALRDRLGLVRWTIKLDPSELEQARATWASHVMTQMPFQVLRYILVSARYSLRPLTVPAERINAAGLMPGTIQLAVVGGDEAREAAFLARREAAGGSFWAFHGAPLDWRVSYARNCLSRAEPALDQAGTAFSGTAFVHCLELPCRQTGRPMAAACTVAPS
jgi:hypothetical protein